MSTTYSHGGFRVTVESDGSILVKAGDTIGGYSKAIHGDFKHMHEYSRPNGNQTVPVENINLIYAGETLFHEPSRPAALDPTSTVPATTPGGVLPTRYDGTYDIDRIMREQRILPGMKKSLKYLLNSTRLGLTGVSYGMMYVTEASKLSAAIASVPGGVTTVGVGLPMAGAFLSIFAGCYAIWNAGNYNVDQIEKRAIIYGGVAYAFDHAVPPIPRTYREILSNRDLEGTGRFGSYLGSEGLVAAWDRNARIGYNRIPIYCQQNDLNPDGVKPLLRASLGDPESPYAPKLLAAEWMLEFAEVFYPDGWGQSDAARRRHFMQPYSWYPHDSSKYRPSYPPEIDLRYPK